MTPLVIIPARQMSEGQPCKNRQHWWTCQSELPPDWPVVVVSDDLLIQHDAQAWPIVKLWHVMGPTHTVAEAVRVVMDRHPHGATDVVVILQPSSPTTNRAVYVRAAVSHLEHHPEHSAVVSVVPWVGEPPSKACTLAEDGRLVIPASPEPRQAQPRHYRRDGTVYAVRAEYARVGDLYGPHPVPLLIDPADSVTLD